MRGLAVSSSSSSEDNVNRQETRGRAMMGEDNTNTDTDKRDILDLLKLSYIVVRTGIGTGQIMVRQAHC